MHDTKHVYNPDFEGQTAPPFDNRIPPNRKFPISSKYVLAAYNNVIQKDVSPEIKKKITVVNPCKSMKI